MAARHFVLRCVYARANHRAHGRLDLDAPAKIYAPEIGKLQVLEGFDDRGQPRLRPPRRDVATRMLLLHTAGFGYDFFNQSYNRLARERHG